MLREDMEKPDALSTAVPHPEGVTPVNPVAEEATKAAEKPADNTNPGDTAAETADDDQGTAEKKPNKVPANKRIGQLTAQKNAALADADRLRERVARLEAEASKQLPDDATLDQVDDHRLKRTLAADKLEDAKERLQEVTQTARKSRIEAFSEIASDVSDKMPGLIDKIKALPKFTEDMGDFLVESEKGAEVGWYLGENPHEASRIAELPPTKRGIELARIEARLTSAKPKRVSNAPNPVPQVGGGGSPPQKAPENMTTAEHVAYYAAQKKAKQG